ncbi:Gfo/Idh/MocA family oxidoreductase [Nocardioides dongxiaopingii]|uniref:Gfo/Idh/MocA family protein n=1 Tax=Nocardioides sp. S-1144 TaxID=2582905 RepID=UPI0011620F88|nr:Gfo/Idh/MocA family oxidoreductase [Nocardioides sp. S-1144]QDH10647.1 Gfo/Idh/MocA family oxidoreductase [Nocardioides sp. S-1144]
MSLLLPAPRRLDPYAVPPVRWGVVGTGIGARFVASLHAHSHHRVVAWAARDAARTQATAREHGVERCHRDVRSLLEDPDVDAVYVATPHPLHREHALQAIAAGKHVLVEKPMAMTAADAAAVTGAAAAAGVLAMEAMWTRYLPQTDVLRQVLADGLIGEPHLVRADLGSAVPYDAGHRLWSPELGGGALLDVGIYPVSLASMVLGRLTTVAATGTLAPSGVDASAHLLLSAGDATALVSTSLVSSLPTTAEVAGSAGHLRVAAPFFAPSSLSVTVGSWDSSRTATWTHPRPPGPSDGPTDGYAFQAIAFAHYVAEGRVESPLHPHDETVSVLATLDEARRRLGVAGQPAAPLVASSA